MASCAALLGRNDELLPLLERAHQAYLTKLGVPSRAAATAFAYEHRLI